MNQDNIITIDELSNLKKYTCNISKSTIIFEINNKILLFNYVEFNWEYPKLVLNLLMYSFNDIIKKNKFDKFKYLISREDYKYLDKEKWTLIKDEKDCINKDCVEEDCVKEDCVKKDCVKKDYVKEDCIEEDYVELECPVDLAFENIMQGFVNIL